MFLQEKNSQTYKEIQDLLLIMSKRTNSLEKTIEEEQQKNKEGNFISEDQDLRDKV